MNAIALLGRRVIERVRGIGVASLMLLQILFSMQLPLHLFQLILLAAQLCTAT